MRSNRLLVIILAVSVAGRLAVSLALGDELQGLPGAADQLSYHTLAQRVVNGEGFSFETAWWPATAAGAATAHWSYLHTYFLAGIYTLFGPDPLNARLILAVIMGILQPLLAFAIAKRLFGEMVGLVAAGITALYAYFVYYSATLMTEPFYITAIMAGLYLAIRVVDSARDGEPVLGRILALGIVLGTAVLLRQLFMLFLPFLLGWAWWASGRRLGRILVIPAAVVAVMVLPFTLYNWSRFDSFVLLNTNAGFAFYWANHPVHGTSFIPAQEIENYQELIPPELLHLNEAELDRALLVRGLEFVRAEPLRYILLSISRIPAYFRFWPSASSGVVSNVSRVGSFGLMWPFMVLGVLQWLRDHRSDGLGSLMARPGALLLIFALVYTSIHVLSWALIRYRLPVDAVLIVFAAPAVVELSRRVLNQGAPFRFCAHSR
jgi:4-amino-4-deoxy-L-arabinose transferase-like glycosyltransferase